MIFLDKLAFKYQILDIKYHNIVRDWEISLSRNTLIFMILFLLLVDSLYGRNICVKSAPILRQACLHADKSACRISARIRNNAFISRGIEPHDMNGALGNRPAPPCGYHVVTGRHPTLLMVFCGKTNCRMVFCVAGT